MITNIDKFTFQSPPTDARSVDHFVFNVPCNSICDQNSLFRAYGAGLGAPNRYFGTNWNAFYDCLMGLQWIDKFEIDLVHTNIPKLPQQEFVIYLDIISTAVAEWDSKKTADLSQSFPEYRPHKLSVFFPVSLRRNLEDALKG